MRRVSPIGGEEARVGGPSRRRSAIVGGASLILLVAMALSTKVVRSGAAGDAGPAAFDPAAFGTAAFPKIRADVNRRAVDAATLAGAIAHDGAAAGVRYGVAADAGPEIPVKFTGTVAAGDGGDDEVRVPGVPDGVHITVQTGPAIIGTDLRDATGTITFGQFHNQIEYQNAGAALNAAMKKAVLATLDPTRLAGKTVSVVGVFQLTDPDNWQVTPVELRTP